MRCVWVSLRGEGALGDCHWPGRDQGGPRVQGLGLSLGINEVWVSVTQVRGR